MGVQDSYLKDVFDKPPLTAFRRQNNLRDILVKSKVPPSPPHIHKGRIRAWLDVVTPVPPVHLSCQEKQFR